MSEPVAKPRTMIDLDEFERRLSRPSATSRADGDPLAELARLVGGQPDRLDTVFEEFSATRPAADQLPPPRYQDQWNFPQPAPAAPAFPRTQPLPGDFAAIEAGLRGSIPPEIADFSGARRPQAVPSLQPATFEDAGHETEWDDHAQHVPEFAAASQFAGRRSRRPLYITAAVILVGLGGIGASFALKIAPGGPRELAMIRAADGPTKVLADNSGKADQADQNASILDKGPQPTPVALVNRAEQPVDLSRTDLPQSDRPARVMTIGSAQLAPGAANVPVPPPPGQVYPPGVTMPANMGDLIEPRKVKTVSVKPDGTLLTSDTPQAPKPAPSPPAAKASTPKAAAHVVTTPKTEVASNDADKAAAQDRDQTDAVQDPVTTHSKPAPAKPQKIAAAEPDAVDPASTANGKGAFAVQLAAPATEEEARQSMNRLGKQFSGALSGHHLGYHRASVGDKSVYRVRVGGLSHDEATALCEKLKTSGGACFVAKN
jgi:hypothetical protein